MDLNELQVQGEDEETLQFRCFTGLNEPANDSYSIPVPRDEWMHFAGVGTHADSIKKYYVADKLVISIISNKAFESGTGSFCIARHTGKTAATYVGLLDDLYLIR